MKKIFCLTYAALLLFAACNKEEPVIVPDDTDLSTEEVFNVLGDLSGGEYSEVYSAAQVPETIIEIIQSNAGEKADIVFLIDDTGSMSNDISAVRSALSEIISTLPNDAYLGAATYGDNTVITDWYDWSDLSADFSKAEDFIRNISTSSGGDTPESVYDGIYETVDKMSWRNNSKARMVIVIGDAPPHREESLTNHSLQDVIDLCLSNSIDTNLFPILIK